jgi:cellulose biosynthesis protein BcsQ
MAGHVITFYSYKGGTGRTMALANVAVELARERHARVLAIDWDLEAPGLHRFLEPAEGDEHVGLIELFADARDRLTDMPSEHEGAGVWERATLDAYVGATVEPGLSIMRAGRMDDTYAARVNGFDWEGLYHDAPALFSGFAEALAERYDYVLIDSRTGITDSGGICTMLMPDRLVLVFTPNRQSLAGVLDRAREATDYRSRSDDLRPLLVFPLASRVELSEEELRQEWRHGAPDTSPSMQRSRVHPGRDGYQPTFERLFRELYDLPSCDLGPYFDEVQIQHAPRFAYGEPIAVREESAGDRLSLARSYASFTRALVHAQAPWELPPSRALPAAAAEAPERRKTVLEGLDATTRRLTFQAHRLRRTELLARTLQTGLGVASVIAAFAFAFTTYSGTTYWAPMLVGGAAVVGLIELVARTLAPTDARRALARGAAALERERRLYDACAGPYAQSQAPVATLAERVDEVLAEVDRAAPGAGGA